MLKREKAENPKRTSRDTRVVVTMTAYKTELWRYAMFLYIGFPFLALVATGLFQAVETQSVFEIMMWGPIFIMWIRVLMKSGANIAEITRARRHGRTHVELAPIVLLSAIDRRTLENREFKFVLGFVSFLYLLTLIAIVVNLLGLV